jgi:hypothetical protein
MQWHYTQREREREREREIERERERSEEGERKAQSAADLVVALVEADAVLQGRAGLLGAALRRCERPAILTPRAPAQPLCSHASHQLVEHDGKAHEAGQVHGVQLDRLLVEALCLLQPLCPSESGH